MKHKVKVFRTYNLKTVAVLAAVVVFASCANHQRDYDPGQQHFEPTHQYTADLDMYTSPSLETYQSTHLFADGLTSQKPVEGTIARGYMPYPYADDSTGYSLAGLEWKNPHPSSPEVLAKGKDLYTKFCTHCHGEKGEADGSVIQNSKFPPPPSFLSGQSSKSVGVALMDLPEGKMFHTVTYGQNMMGSHASQLNHDERWMIIAHIKALQAASKPAEESGEAEVDGEAETAEAPAEGEEAEEDTE